MSKSSLRSTLRRNLPKKKSALRAKHTVKQHLGTGGNWFSNQLEYQRSLVFASETKILSIVIYCRGHSLVLMLWNETDTLQREIKPLHSYEIWGFFFFFFCKRVTLFLLKTKLLGLMTCDNMPWYYTS